LVFRNFSADDETSISSEEPSAGSQNKPAKRRYEHFQGMLDLSDLLIKEESLANQSGKKAKEETTFAMYELFLKALERQVEAPEGEDTADHWFTVDCQVRERTKKKKATQTTSKWNCRSRVLIRPNTFAVVFRNVPMQISNYSTSWCHYCRGYCRITLWVSLNTLGWFARRYRPHQRPS
jgi:hypothetical protein